MSIQFVAVEIPLQYPRKILDFCFEYLLETLCKPEYYFMRFYCILFRKNTTANSFAESTSTENT